MALLIPYIFKWCILLEQLNNTLKRMNIELKRMKTYQLYSVYGYPSGKEPASAQDEEKVEDQVQQQKKKEDEDEASDEKQDGDNASEKEDAATRIQEGMLARLSLEGEQADE